MKPMLSAFVAIAVISYAAWWGLGEYAGFSAADRQSAPSVRLD